MNCLICLDTGKIPVIELEETTDKSIDCPYCKKDREVNSNESA